MVILTVMPVALSTTSHPFDTWQAYNWPNITSSKHGWLLIGHPDKDNNGTWVCTHQIVKTPTQPHHTHHQPPLQTQGQQYLSSYRPDFDQTLKIGSWDHLEQILIVTVTFDWTIFVLATFVHFRNVSAVTEPIWTKNKNIWQNFDPNFYPNSVRGGEG